VPSLGLTRRFATPMSNFFRNSLPFQALHLLGS
jgi:hypothetical protein